MRMIPTRIHAIADYAIGVLLIVSPWLFGFATGGIAQWLPMVLGLAVIVYSLLTRYELGLVGAIPMPAHLWLDGIGGALLAVSPWLFGFADVVIWPHLIIGLVEIVAALTTETEPGLAAAPARHEAGGEAPILGNRTIGGIVAAGLAVIAVAAIALGIWYGGGGDTDQVAETSSQQSSEQRVAEPDTVEPPTPENAETTPAS